MSAEEHKVMWENLFIGGGEMGALMRAYDWSQTSLGSVENWSQSLKTSVSILLNAPCPMFLVWKSDLRPGESDARILFYNDASASLFDTSGDLIPCGQRISQDWPKGCPNLRSQIEQVFTTGQPLRQENELFGKESYTWSYSPIRDETAQVGGVLVIGCRDLAENIQPALSNQSFQSIKETLQRREEEWSLITKALPVLIAYIDKNHHYQFNNQTYEAWCGQSTAHITGKHVREVVGESAYEAIRPYIEQALSGQQVSFESQIPYHEGGTHYIRADYIPHINSQGEVEGYFSLVSDISDVYDELRLRKQTQAALHNREAQLRLITDSLPVLISYIDDQLRYRFVNQTYTDWFNIHPQEIIGKHIEDILGQEAYRAIRPDIETVLSGQKFSSEKYVFFKTAGWRYVQRYFVPDIGEDGTVKGYYALVIDVTERRQAEAALRQSEERLRLAMTGAQMGTWDVDLITGKAIWSEQHFTMLGYEPVATGEATEEMWSSRIHPDDLAQVMQEWQQSRQDNRCYRTEYRVIRADNGQISWLAALGNFTYDQIGQAIRSIGVLFDISERKKAEAALQESEERFRLVTQAVNGVVFDWNLQTNEVYRSENLYQLVGINPEDAPPTATWWQERIHPDDLDRLQPQVGELFNSHNHLYEAEYRVRHADGHWVDVWERGCLIRDNHGQVIRLVGSTVDITERQRTEQALRQAEERLRVALQNAPIIVFNQDRELKYSWLHNPVLYDLDEMLGKRDRDFLPPEDAELLTMVKQRVLETGIGVREEIKITRNETNYYYDLTLEPLRDANNTIVGITGAAVDISQLKQTEIDLRESEARFRGVVESNMVGILFWDASGCITDGNDMAVQMLGYSRDELQSRQVYWQEITPPEFHEIDATMLAQILGTGVCPPFEKAYIRKDGTKVPILIGCGLLPGYSDRGVAYFIDISERKQTEEALRESEERFRNMADTAPVLIWMSDTSKLCTYFNKHWLEFTGRTIEQELGNGWAEGVHPDDLQYCLNVYTHAFDARQEFKMEYRLRCCDGQYRWILDHGIPRFTPDGEFVGYIGSCIDIHDRKQTEAALRASEERLQIALEGANLGTWDYDLTDGKLIWSDRCKAMFGLPAEAQMNYTMFLQAVHPEDRPQIDQAVTQAIAQQQDYDVEMRTLGADGTVRWLRSIGRVYRNRQGLPVRMAGVALDITARKQAEAAVRDREQRLTLATNAAQLGVFEWDIQTDHTVWENQRMYDIFGHTIEDGTLSKTQFCNSVIHPDDRPAFEQSLAQGIQLGTLHQLVCRIRCQDNGEWRWIETNGHFTFAPDGTPLRLVGVVADITKRQQAEAALRQSEERLRLAQQAAGAGLWDWDITTNQVTWSEEYYQIYGLDATVTPTYENWLASILPSDREQADQATREALAHRTNLNVEFRILHPTQGICWITAIGQTFCDADGQPKRMTGIAFNITDRKQAEAEREQLLAREQVARQEAERANRIKDEFLAVLSHELRSPLNPILGWSRLLQGRQLDTEKTAQALAVIERNAKLQSELIEDLLDVSRILQGKLRLNVVVVDLAATIKSALETVRLAAQAKSIQIQQRLDPEIGAVSGDSARLQQVIWNLLSNAVKFTPQGGRVDVRLEQHGNQAQITVSDTGKGIAADFLPYVFEYFRQADATTTRKFGGLGLGLAIVRHLVELHGGTVEAESPGEGQGATFTVRLPLLSKSPQISQKHQASKLSVDLSGVQVLLVDDDADTREFVAFLLEQAGAKVVTAKNASEAFVSFMESQPDVLISDIGMPDMDGYMLIQQVRALPAAKGGKIPAIALTAYAGDFNQQQALRAGFQQHISKPVEPEILLRAITNLIG